MDGGGVYGEAATARTYALLERRAEQILRGIDARQCARAPAAYPEGRDPAEERTMTADNLLFPEIGQWYQRADRPQPFQVVAIDERAETVEIEYFDGTVDEWPLSHWHALDIEPSGAPPDASGALDDGIDGAES